ncbi:MAG: hypothetical protein Q7R89_03405 [bacterium]|nr:hypothetical protein [bacterium]
MEKSQRKQRIRRVIYSAPSLIVLLLIAFLLAKGAVGVMNKEWESREQSNNLEGKTAALVTRERELRENIARLETEEGIKDEIRKRFSVTQEGELVAVIVDDSRVSTSTDSSLWPWYKKLWFAIIGSNESR